MDDKRLIEDYLPIEAISAEASREKSVRKGHISTLHLWWARRPLVACRAAVYGALVPASRFVPACAASRDAAGRPNNGSDEKKKSLGRANSAKFVKSLCLYPGSPSVIQEAQRHILEAHADRLTAELQEGRDGSPSRPKNGALGESALPPWVEEFKWSGEKVTVEDITAGRAPRPRVLDMFAGGGAIPLEALRLGCEAYALDLNPVAHIIQLCTLVYPQKYGKPDPSAKGMVGPKGPDGQATWGGLAEEVRYWGNWVLKKVKAEIGDLYPLIPDPKYKGKRPEIEIDIETGDWVVKRKPGKSLKDDSFAPPQRIMGFAEDSQLRLSAQSEIKNQKSKIEIPPGYLMPVAYLWTRTVKCKNPTCGATVPLVKQTWLCKKDGRYVAMKMVAPKGKKEVHFEVVESRTEKGLIFDPEAFSKGGNAACPFCGTVADSDYVMEEGCGRRVKEQLMAVVCTSLGQRGKTYITPSDADAALMPSPEQLALRLAELSQRSGLPMPDEPIGHARPSPNARGLTAVTRHGLVTFGDLFNMRQKAFLLAFASQVETSPWSRNCDEEQGRALAAYMAGMLDKIADYGSSFCRWISQTEAVADTFARHALAMMWDYAELNPLGSVGSNAESILDSQVDAILSVDSLTLPAIVFRGSATQFPDALPQLDAIITDPPYYDNIPYADVSDFFYVWQKRSLRRHFPEHFSSSLTPKKNEATALSSRYNGDMAKANAEYERMMFDAFAQASEHLKRDGQLTVVYAHKTTLGWATLVQALKNAGFMVTEAWPLDTERGARPVALDTSALASSIFLVARKRDVTSKAGLPAASSAAQAGNYETDVVPELASIVRERVETLWEMGISGADLVIACVGAGLRAFTKYARVEYGNGEEVPAERFLMEVEAAVLESILGKLSKEVAGRARSQNAPQTDGSASRPYQAGNLAALDPATRFYVLWRYTYGAAELDAGEAIIFANGTHVELEGQHSLTQGNRALLEKKKSKYRLHDFTERGNEEKLGSGTGVSPVGDHGQDAHATTIDALHRLLWLLEHKPLKIPDFLNEAKPNIEQLRLVAQALAGPALKGLPAALRSAQAGGELSAVSTTAEQSALGKLLANWNAVMVGKVTVEDRRKGQQTLEI